MRKASGYLLALGALVTVGKLLDFSDPASLDSHLAFGNLLDLADPATFAAHLPNDILLVLVETVTRMNEYSFGLSDRIIAIGTRWLPSLMGLGLPPMIVVHGSLDLAHNTDCQCGMRWMEHCMMHSDLGLKA